MIYGPIVPRTQDGLAEVVLRAPERLEGGLQTVVEGLRLGEGILVDAVARDASGLPVLLFLAPPPDDRSVPARVVEALSWFDEFGAALRDVLQRRAVRLDRGVRAIVACFDLTDTTLRRLRELADPRITVLRLEPFQIGGQRDVGVVPLLDHGRPHLGARVTDAGLPSALDDYPRARRFLDLIDRLDPVIEASGDRYRRSFSYRGTALATLCRVDDVVEVRFAGAAPLPLREEADVAIAFDRVARRYLASQRRSREDSGPTSSAERPSGPRGRAMGSTDPHVDQRARRPQPTALPDDESRGQDLVGREPRRHLRPAAYDDEFADSCGPVVEAPERSERRLQSGPDDFDLPILEP